MKKLLLTLACTLATVACFAQGTINFTVKNGADNIDAKITDSKGALLAGTGFSAQLYAGPANSAESALKAVGGIVNFRTGTAAGYALSPSPSVITIPGVAGGQKATLQLRAWDNAGGTITSWEAAANGSRGQSALFQSPALGDNSAVPPTPAPNPVGLTGFSLTTVPEPSTIALGVLGAAALLARRRK